MTTAHPRAPRRHRLALAGLLALAALGAQAETHYRVQLMTQPEGFTAAEGLGVNDAGLVVGRAFSTEYNAIRWEDRQPVHLSRYALAMGVNLRGDVVGSLGSQGMVWHADGRRTTLRGLDGGFSVTQGAAIAPSGVSVGMAQVNNVEQAARWDPSGAATALPGLCDGCASTATAVASDGWAAGQVDRLRGRDWAPHAALWHGTRLIDLSPDDTDTASRAQGVNALGVAVGWRQDGVRRMAMRWQDGTTVILPALRDGAQDRCEALAVNVHGDIVGYCTGESLEHRAVVWRRSGALRDLNTQLPHRLRDAGWRLSQAAAVSDKGYITGEAVNTRTGERRAFLLTRQR